MTKGFIHTVCILVLLFLSACNTSRTTNSAFRPKGILIKSLQANNLSEDWTAAASQNDEILLLIHLMIPDGDLLNARFEKGFRFTFDQFRKEFLVRQNIPILSSDIEEGLLLFTLIEMDNENTETEVSQIISKYIRSGDFLKGIDKTELDKKLPYDDFLGLKYIYLKEWTEAKDFSLEFSGMQLFDQYEYYLLGKIF